LALISPWYFLQYSSTEYDSETHAVKDRDEMRPHGTSAAELLFHFFHGDHMSVTVAQSSHTVTDRHACLLLLGADNAAAQDVHQCLLLRRLLEC
jgi:hypothetical protein